MRDTAMRTARVNGVTLEYEMTGEGAPVLFISPVVADGFLPLAAQPALADRHCLITYHRRGWVGSTHSPPPVSMEDHAEDAAGLLAELGVGRAHVAGHSSGAAIALQLALDHRHLVRSLCLLEPSLLWMPATAAFMERAGPAFELHAAGDDEAALATFMSAVSGLEWSTCRALLDARIPGAVAQALEDADTLFDVELPALTRWSFSAEQADAIRQPVLSVLGAHTEPLWLEVAAQLRAWFPQLEECVVKDAGHLLHMQQPEVVARCVSAFLSRQAGTALNQLSTTATSRPES